MHLYSTYTGSYCTYLTDCQKIKSIYWTYIPLIFYLYLLILHLSNRLSKKSQLTLDLCWTYSLRILAYTVLFLTDCPEQVS